MPISFNLRKVLDRKEWEMLNPCPTANGSGMFLVPDFSAEEAGAWYVCSTTVIYHYSCEQDAWTFLPASGIAGVFGIGACGVFHPYGPSAVATGGTTTTINTNLTINNNLVGYRLRITSGPGAGDERIIASNTLGANSIITVTQPFSTAITNASNYLLLTGRLWFFCPGTAAVGFAFYDRALNTWTQRSVVGLPTAWGTEGQLVQTCLPFGQVFASGTATGATTTTLVNSARNWTTNQWTNSQVRITAGTGVGQTRIIASNTNNTLTVTAAWTVVPDTTSQYVIEGNDDFIYLLGNNAVTLFRFQISTNTWTTITPAVARGGALNAGGGAIWVHSVSDPQWTNENAIINGRRIYSFRGGGSTILDFYDIPSNSWSVLTYTPQAETFTTGSCFAYDENHIYIQKESTCRFFRFNLIENRISPFSTLVFPDSTAVIGNKIWVQTLIDGNTRLKWLYKVRNAATELFRCMVIDNSTNVTAGGWFIREL